MSDTVKVSDRMRKLVDQFEADSYEYAIKPKGFDAKEREAHMAARNALLREIATLEAKVEFLGRVAADITSPDPADFTCLRCGKSVQPGAHTCLPQKPGWRVNCAHCGTIIDGKPFLVEQEVSFCRIQCAEEYGTVPSYRPQTLGEEMPKKLPVDPVIEWLIDYLKVRVEFGSTSEELVRATIDSYRIENARLLTALEEKEKELRDTEHRIPPILRENTRLEQILASRDQMIAQLQSAAVLQKEELEQKTKRIGELENYHRNCLLSIEQLEARLKRAPKSPTSGA